jgi:hypothetical protein
MSLNIKLFNVTEDEVVVCNWDPSLHCGVIAPGYTFNKQVGNTLTVEMPFVNENMLGAYICQPVPLKDGEFDILRHCILNGTVHYKDVSTRPTQESNNGSSTSPETQNSTGDSK